MSGKDYYEVLGVKKDATADELKAAYRKISLKTHPDRQAGKSEAEKKDAEERFKAANEAYSVLSDPEKRRNYDQFGSAEGPGHSGGGFEGFDPMSFFRKMSAGFGMGGFDDDDGGFDGFGFGMGGSRRRQAPDYSSPEDGSDVQTKISVTFKESVKGCVKEFDFDLDGECPDCHGTGVKSGTKPEKCPECGGKCRTVRVSRTPFGMTQMVSNCRRCHGTGYSVEQCPKCGGGGRVGASRHVKVKVPAGFRDGQQLRLKGLGRCGVKGGSDGNLYVVVNVGKSDVFERNGDDVLVRAYVSPSVASLGGKVRVPTPYGYRNVKVAPGTVSGTRLKVSGAGIKTASGTGDMYIDLVVEPYSDLTKEQKDLLERLQKTETESNFRDAKSAREAADRYYAE